MPGNVFLTFAYHMLSVQNKIDVETANAQFLFLHIDIILFCIEGNERKKN